MVQNSRSDYLYHTKKKVHLSSCLNTQWLKSCRISKTLKVVPNMSIQVMFMIVVYSLNCFYHVSAIKTFNSFKKKILSLRKPSMRNTRNQIYRLNRCGNPAENWKALFFHSLSMFWNTKIHTLHLKFQVFLVLSRWFQFFGHFQLCFRRKW